MHATANNHSLAEGQPWLGAVPVHEFVDGVAIAALGIRAGQAIENRRLRDFKIRQSQDGFCSASSSARPPGFVHTDCEADDGACHRLGLAYLIGGNLA